MNTKEETIFFPEYAHSYEVQGGPDLDSLIAAMKDPTVKVVFTFISDVDGTQVTSDVEVQVNSVQPVDTGRTVYTVGGSVVTANGFDERFTIQRYDTSTRHGTNAAVFM